MKVSAKRPINIVLVFALVALSTIPFFKSPFGVFLILGCILYLHRHLLSSIKAEALAILLVVTVLEIYHSYAFDNYDGWVTRQIILFFFVGIFTIYYLKLNFLTIYVQLMYYTTLVSFVVFSIYLLSPNVILGFANLMPSIFTKTSSIYDDVYKQVNPIFYNFDHNLYKGRNNGPFWEPTVFASLLILGQIFNFLLNKSFFNKIGIVFSIGILTTLSTTVFLAYFIFLTSYFLLNKRFKVVYKMAFLLISVCGGIYLFSNLSFLEEKINTELLNIDNNIDKRGGDSRMASALLDLGEVSQNSTFLLFGKGSSINSRIGGTDKEVLRNCGLTALLVEWGIFFFILYISLLFYSFYSLTKHYQINVLFSVPFTLIILLVSFSEVFFDLPLFHSLIFIGLMINKFYKNKKSSTNFTQSNYEQNTALKHQLATV